MLATLPHVSLDVERSLVCIGGARFPAAVILDPIDGRWWNGVVNLSDPGWTEAWSICVPMENGALVDVVIEKGRMSLYLHGRVWLPRNAEDDLEVAWADVVGKAIVVSRTVCPYRGSWYECEPEWVAWHLTRLSTLPVVSRVEGKPVELRPIAEALSTPDPAV